MITKESINHMAGHVFRHAKGIRDNRTMHPTREWFFGLVLFLVIVCIGGAKSAHTFIQYKHVEVIEGTFDKKVATYNTALAEKALKIYSERKDNYIKLQENHTYVVPIEEEVVASSTQPVVEEPIVDDAGSTDAVELVN